MRAVVFDLSLVKYGLAKAFGKRVPSLYYGRPSCMQLREVPEPSLRGPDWAKVRVESCGFCGSDLSLILFKFSPQMSPFSSMPCVLGHEIYGRLVEVGAGARQDGFREGDRVVVNPAFGCRVRGLQPLCPACESGHPATCHRAGAPSGGLAPGYSLGYHRDLPGGFSESLIAHRSQLVRVPDGVPSARAVLAEPLAIAVHAVCKHEPRDDDRVLIIGGGMIAYAVLTALRLLGHRAHVTQLLLLDYQAQLARDLGADEVLRPGPDLLERVCALTGATRHKPILGEEVLTGGFSLVFDCIGAPESVRDALRFTRSQGTIVLVGAAGEVPKLDLSSLWTREQRLLGTAYYGPEPSRAGRHSLELATELLAEPAAARLERLITHRFPLEKLGEAVRANIERARFRSVKTVFTPSEAS
jgi:threonine dehydrogenase-like Zn-dependent dehydrogenase